MTRFRLLFLALIAGLGIPGPDSALAVRAQLNAELGGPFPDLAFEGLVAPEDFRGLGLEKTEGEFRLSEIPGELLVIEFFNQFCFTCQRQAPYLNAFAEAVASGDLRGRVRVLGVGVGNRAKDLKQFRQEFSANYPLTPDPSFDRFLEVGDPGGTPFSVFLKREQGRWVLADYHMGLEGDAELMARTRVLLEGRTARRHGARPAGASDRHPELGLSDAERESRAREFLSRVAGRPVEVRLVDLAARGQVFAAIDGAGRPIGLYARLASRDPVCDLCHAIHFYIAFDSEGKARGFEPVHVTKYGNELWSPEDTERMDRALRGRPLEGLAFDPAVDAVTSATMSSALIFDEVRRARALLPELANR